MSTDTVSNASSLSPAKSALGMLTKMEDTAKDTASKKRKQTDATDDSFAPDPNDPFNVGDEMEEKKLVEFMFTKCGQLMMAQDASLKRHVMDEWSSLDHTMALSAEIKRDLALDYVIFLRSLLRN